MDIWIVSGDTVNNATINIYVQDFFFGYGLISLGFLLYLRIEWGEPSTEGHMITPCLTIQGLPKRN